MYVDLSERIIQYQSTIRGPKKAAAVFRNHGPNFDDKKVFILQVLIILQ